MFPSTKGDLASHVETWRLPLTVSPCGTCAWLRGDHRAEFHALRPARFSISSLVPISQHTLVAFHSDVVMTLNKSGRKWCIGIQAHRDDMKWKAQDPILVQSREREE